MGVVFKSLDITLSSLSSFFFLTVFFFSDPSSDFLTLLRLSTTDPLGPDDKVALLTTLSLSIEARLDLLGTSSFDLDRVS